MTLEQLSEVESFTLDALLRKLDKYNPNNDLKLAYYEGQQRVNQLGISIPPRVLDKIEICVGWAGTAVDVLEERLDWLGWNDTAGFGLDEVFTSNDLDVDSGLGHVDALIFGTSFACVGTGAAGEPSPLVTIESPRDMTGNWDARSRRLLSAASRYVNPESNETLSAVLYLPDETVTVERGTEGAPWTVTNRDKHNLGRVPVAQIVNRPRASNRLGRSEISHAVRGYTDAAVRTLLGMEVNREFYSAPQRWAMQVSPDQFTRADGSVVTGWEAVMGRMLAVPFDEDNPEAKPEVGQFAQSQPGPYLEQVRGLSQMLSAECAIPPTYLGFASDQAASADAIRAMEARLVKRAERRQLMFGKAWLEVGRLALLVRDKKVPDEFNAGVSLKWRDAATPTRSAAADEATKLVAAGVLTPDSSVTYDRIGLTQIEQKQVAADKRQARVSVLLSGLSQRATAQAAPPADPGAAVA